MARIRSVFQGKVGQGQVLLLYTGSGRFFAKTLVTSVQPIGLSDLTSNAEGKGKVQLTGHSRTKFSQRMAMKFQ